MLDVRCWMFDVGCSMLDVPRPSAEDWTAFVLPSMPFSQAGGKEKGTDMSRIGKIARLPHDIREQLNRRVLDGQSGPDILQWVNQLPQCRQMLTQKFGGRPIDEGNLYEWRHGGYEEWLYHEDRRDRLHARFEHLAKLDAVGDGGQTAERLGIIIASELAVALNYLEGINDMDVRWARLREISRELSRFRRENCNHQRLRLAEQRLENEMERHRKVGRVTVSVEALAKMDPCAPLQLQQKRRARSNASYPERSANCGPRTVD
jgi:hypothetical protein